MTMLFLSRLEHGWGMQATMQQLTTSSDALGKPNLSELPNLWQSEMETLIENNKLGK